MAQVVAEEKDNVRSYGDNALDDLLQLCFVDKWGSGVNVAHHGCSQRQRPGGICQHDSDIAHNKPVRLDNARVDI